MIRRTQFDRMHSQLAAAGVGDALDAILRGGRGGRPRQLDMNVYAAGMLFAAMSGESLALSSVHKILTTELPRSAQIHYGIRYVPKGGTQARPISVRQIRYPLEQLEMKLAATQGRAPDLSEADQHGREQALQNIVDLVIGMTVPTHLPTVKAVALDASGIEAWGKRKFSATGEDCTSGPDEGERQGTVSFDPDARTGYRTWTYDNKTKWVFGYDLFSLVSVVPLGADPDSVPKLTHAMTVRPAGLDVVDPALKMLDSLANAGSGVSQVLDDRAWSYKTEDRWANVIRDRGVEQVLDLHPNDHGVRDFEGIRMIDGAPHCPSTPDELTRIERPARFSVGQPKRNASPEDIAKHEAGKAALEQFRVAIAERQKYAFRRVQGPDGTGKERYECPAQSGKFVCENCPMSQFLPEGTPRVENPPTGPGKPKACSQRTVTIPGDVTPKIRQILYWGSDEWIKSFSRRTHVEGIFGNMKNPKTENVKRGWCFVVGLVKTSMLLAFKAAATNIRLIKKWAERTSDYTHPLTEPEPPDHGFEELDAGGNIQLHAPPISV